MQVLAARTRSRLARLLAESKISLLRLNQSRTIRPIDERSECFFSQWAFSVVYS